MERIPFVNVNACGQKMTGIYYLAQQPTNRWLIFLHGIGEVGPLDGSTIIKVEKNGYPKHIAAGLQLPFNVFAPQTPVQNYNNYRKVLVPHLMAAFGAEVIVLTGLSMGGIETWNNLWLDSYQRIQAIVPVCGMATYKDITTGVINYSLASKIPVLAVHGDKDAKVPYLKGQASVEGLNSINPGQAELITLPGVAHEAWEQAYDVTHSVGKRVLSFIVSALSTTTNYESGFFAFQNLVMKQISLLKP